MCGFLGRITLLLSAPMFLMSAVSVKAIEPKDVSYFCVAEAAGGLSFSAPQKKWVGTVFKVTEKFVLRLKYIDAKFGTGKWDKDELYTNFEVALTPAGTNSESRCLQLGSGDKKSVSVSQYDSFTCSASIEEYYFNLKTNRYLNVYPFGYVDGTDSNENTPSVTGGVCTKIN